MVALSGEGAQPISADLLGLQSVWLDLRTDTVARVEWSERGGHAPAGVGVPSEGMAVLRRVTRMVRERRRELNRALAAAEGRHEALSRKRRGIFETFAPGRSADREAALAREAAEIERLRGDLKDLSVRVHFDPASVVQGCYSELSQAFISLTHSVIGFHVSDPAVADPSAHDSLELELGEGHAITFDGRTLRFETQDGESLVFYPGMLMRTSASGERSLWEFRHVRIDHGVIHTTVGDLIPPDTAVVRNASGYALNRVQDPAAFHGSRAPVCAFGQLTIHAPDFVVRYRFSNNEAAEAFARAYKRFCDTVYDSGG